MIAIKRYIILFLALLFANSGHAQDALFSQMKNAGNLLNPAILSMQNNPISIGLSFREQGASISSGLPIRTFQVQTNFVTESFEVDQFNYGLSILSDKGGTGHIGSNHAYVNVGYLKKITGRFSKIGEHYIGIGSSIGIGQRNVGWDRFWFGNQFNREYNFIEEGKDPREDEILATSNGNTGIYTDINAGIAWYANLKEDLSMELGFSLYHLTRPNISFFENGNEALPIRYNLHGSLYKKFSELLTLSPAVIYLNQGHGHQLIMGSDIGMDNNDDYEFGISFGVFARMVASERSSGVESIILSLNSDYNRFQFGLAYDITVSSLSRYNNGYGAWEFSLAYSFLSKAEKNTSQKIKKFKL